MKKNVFCFDGESYCVVFCLEHSDVVRMTSNIADENVASMIVDSIRKNGGHVFCSVKAGVLIAAIELIQEKRRGA